MPKTKRVILSLPVQMHDELTKQASLLGLTVASFIRYLLTKKIEELRNESDGFQLRSMPERAKEL